MPDKITSIIAAVIANVEVDEKRFEDRIKELESEGYRIINGGGGYPDHENDSWVEEPYTDYRTGDVVEKDEDGKYYHTDAITYETYQTDSVDSLGLPQSLVDHIQEWVWDNEEEAREVLKAA